MLIPAHAISNGEIGSAAVDIAMSLRHRWLGDLDSNQGCPGQSREFYR